MSKLIPTPVVDKNGKRTTVHKRASEGSSASRLVGIAPTLHPATPRPSAAKQYKPTAQQLTQISRIHNVHSSKIDPALHPLLQQGSSTAMLSIKASDVELYETLANIADTTNALACYRVNGEAVPGADFLREHNLTHLENTDAARREMMQEALERRIPASDFADFDKTFSAYSDTPQYLDAVQAYSIPTLKKIPDFVSEVRRGNIRMADVIAVGMGPIGKMKRHLGPVVAREMFADLVDGTAKYNPEQLKVVFSKCHKQSSAFIALQLIRQYGGEKTAEIKDFELAHDISLLSGTGPDDALYEAISYADRFRQKTFRNHKQVFDLYRAGVDLDFAVEHSREVDRVSVQQIIARYEGISSPLTGGWL